MATPFLGEVRMFGFNFAPRGWAYCNGQIMSIQQNSALFALLSTTYGGDGRTTFGLPDLRGRVPMHTGSGYVQGQRAGTENVTLTVNQIPSHTHSVQANKTAGANNQLNATGNFWANSGNNTFSSNKNSTMAPGTVSPAGGSQPHSNLSPLLVVNMCIALQGIFPSRN